jgi:hypothetical protein
MQFILLQHKFHIAIIQNVSAKNEHNIEAEKYLKCVRYRKLLNQVLYMIRKNIISYSAYNDI